jgi:uncharacterized protein (TIGR03083 family)
MAGTTRTTGRTLTHEEWMTAAREEYRRLDQLLRDLRPEEWERPTDCDEWDVHAMVAHLVGGADCAASVREMLRQAYRGRRIRKHGDLVDKMNAVQVAERIDHSPTRLVADLAVAGERAVRARSRLPRPVRAVPLPFGPPLGTKPLGYLMDRIYTRDEWMHRMDICRATGRPPLLTADHDGRIVDDVVREWAARHGRPYELELTGPAGGTWSSGRTATRLSLDAVDFCRAVSGRSAGEGLLATTVPF